ncbi:MAG: thymidylate kinase [Dehalococcoidia bacterium]|nr:thymidylate kinase [Dehalococcoidia bacterium]
MNTVRFYGHTPPVAGDEPTLGRLIVVEGTDGVGRSTQIAMLQEWLEAEGYAVLVTGLRRSELASSGIDRAMRGNTLDALTLNLFYATDFWDRLEKSIIPAMRSGMVALIDRYIYSIIARARVRGVPPRWLNDVFEFAVVPDRVLFLDVDVEHLLPRVLAVRQLDHWESGDDFLGGTDLYENFIRYQSALIDEFRELAKEHNFVTVDARGSVSEVFQALQAEVREAVKGMGE